MEDDAKEALARFQGYELHGRKISLEFGIGSTDRKKRKSEEDVKTGETPSTVENAVKNVVQKKAKVEIVPSQPESKKVANNNDGIDDESADSTSDDHVKPSRQLLVFGIPTDVNKKDFKLILFKYSRKSSVDLIKEDHELSSTLHIIDPPGKIMLITAPSRTVADKLLTVFNTTTLNNLGFSKFVDEPHADKSSASADELLKLHYRLKERFVARRLADITAADLRKRKCRLIIHNLSFQAIEKNIIDKLKKFGPLVEVEIPRVTIQKSGKRRVRNTKSEEEENDEKSNLNVVERPKGFGFVTFLCESDAKSAVEQSQGLRICNREIAIDHSMSKSTFERFGNKAEENEEEVTKDVSEDKDAAVQSSESDEDEEEEEESDLENADKNLEDNVDQPSLSGDGDDSESEDNSKAPIAIEPVKERKEDVSEGKTIFLRGLPFDVTGADLKEIFGVFGKIELAIIVTDKVTGVSKGSAFLKFFYASSAEKCLAAHSFKKVNIKDHDCFIDMAVNKEQVKDLTLLHQQQKAFGKDKRNMYLANEGLLLNQQNVVLSSQDREKLTKAQIEKKKKLQNPLFFVSNVRLSVRNLNKSIQTDQELKIMCLEATKAGLQKKLVTEVDIKNVFVAQGYQNNSLQNQMLNYQKFAALDSSSANPDSIASLHTVPPFDKRGIHSCKIMVDYQKLRNSLPQSKGYAFIEFTHHAFALACLRELNQNYKQYENLAIQRKSQDSNKSDNTESAGRLIVEFSLEDFRKVLYQTSFLFEISFNLVIYQVKLLKDRQERAKAKAVKAKEQEGEVAEKPTAAFKKRKSESGPLTSELKQNKKAKLDDKGATAKEEQKNVVVETPSKGKKHLSEAKLRNKVKSRQQSAKKKVEKSAVSSAKDNAANA